MNKEQAKRKAFLPLIGYIVMILLTYYGFFADGNESYADDVLMLIAIILTFVVPIYTIVVMVQFIIFMAELPDISEKKKVFWGILLCFFNVFVFPIYWHIHMKNRDFDYCGWKETMNKRRDTKMSTRTVYYTRGGNVVYREKKNINNIDKERTKSEAYLPLIGYLIICALLLYCGIRIYRDEMTNSIADNCIMLLTIAMIFIVAVFTIIVTIQYILIIYRKPDMCRWKKILWAIVVFEFNVFVFPVFWHVHISKERTGKSGEEQLQAIKRGMTAKQAAIAAFLPLLLWMPIILLFALDKRNVANGYPSWELTSNLFVFLALFFLPIYTFLTVIDFIIHVIHNSYMSGIKKVFWCIYIFIFTIIAFPSYWMLHVDKNDLKEELKYRKDIVIRNRRFDKKRNAELKENKAIEKQQQRMEKKEENNVRRQEIVLLFRKRTPVFFAVLPILLLVGYQVLDIFGGYYIARVLNMRYGEVSDFREQFPILVVFVTVISFIVFLLQVICKEAFSIRKKIGWIIFLLVFNAYAFPIYWDMHLRRKNDKAERKRVKRTLVWGIMPGVSVILFGILSMTDIVWKSGFMWYFFDFMMVGIPMLYVFVVLKYMFLLCENKG